MQVTPKQLMARDKLVAGNGGVVWWRVGTGKTRIALSWFALNAKIKKAPCNFLVVCRREAFRDWLDELRKVGLNWFYMELESAEQFDCSLLKSSKSTMYVMSHGKLERMSDELRNVAIMFDAVVYDEGYLYKNSQSQRCKSAHLVSNAVGKAAILSGSVMTARNTEDVYGQLYAIDRQGPIGRTLTDFRSRYRYQLKITNDAGYRGPRFVNRARSFSSITTAIRGICSIYFPANNQRRIVEATRVCSASRAQARAFQELREFYSLSLKGKELEIKNVPTLITKCQQISDGFIQIPTDIGGLKPQLEVVSILSAKLDYLSSQVDELLACGEKVVIWCAFRESVRLVLHRMQKDFPNCGCYGMMGGSKFNRDGWMKNGNIFVATEASGSSFNSLRDCAYAIYYSMDFHWLHLQQSMGRTNRKDSLHQTCFYNFLQTEGSMDDHVLRIVRSSSKEEQMLLTQAAIKSWLKQ